MGGDGNAFGNTMGMVDGLKTVVPGNVVKRIVAMDSSASGGTSAQDAAEVTQQDLSSGAIGTHGDAAGSKSFSFARSTHMDPKRSGDVSVLSEQGSIPTIGTSGTLQLGESAAGVGAGGFQRGIPWRSNAESGVQGQGQ